MIDFYTIDSAYLDFLRQHEQRIPLTTYPAHEKFFCGVVLNINGVNYFAPVSHYNQPNRTTFVIKDKNDQKILSSVRLNYMFPALPSVVQRLDIKQLYKKDPKYAVLVTKELRYCSRHESDLRNMAMSVYRIGCNPNHVLHQLCCDFSKLESVYKSYLSN